MTLASAPLGCTPLQQSQVTADMTTWAVAVLNDPTAFPMFSFTVKAFGTTSYLARVEWHPPDQNNTATHRGVTLYAIPSIPPVGLDVSGYQPTVNWAAVAAAGNVFAFIKATEGTTLTDAQFSSHWAGAKAAGLLRGAYHFFRPELDAVAQAKYFIAQLGDKGELPPVVDVEVSDNVALSQVAAGVSTFIDYMTANYGRLIVYSMPGFWNVLPAIPNASKADLWVANWGVTSPMAVSGWSSWTFWQFTDKATISGIPGTADQDDDRFNGTYASLLAWASGSVTPVTPSPLPPTPPDLTTVKGVQQALIAHGYNLGPTGADGVAGPLTRTALSQFQTAKNISLLDACGPLTKAALG
jgi:lysozyme